MPDPPAPEMRGEEPNDRRNRRGGGADRAPAPPPDPDTTPRPRQTHTPHTPDAPRLRSGKSGQRKAAQKLGAILGRRMGKTVLKQVPLLGDLYSAVSALQKALTGDFRGAVREAISAIPVVGTVVDVAEAVGTVFLDRTANLLDKVRQEWEQRQLQEFLNNADSLTITKSLNPAKLQPRPDLVTTPAGPPTSAPTGVGPLPANPPPTAVPPGGPGVHNFGPILYRF